MPPRTLALHSDLMGLPVTSLYAGALGLAYRGLAATLAGGGLAYLLAPALSSKLALGTVGTAPARLLWQVLGASNVGLSLLCLNLAMAAAQVRMNGAERGGWCRCGACAGCARPLPPNPKKKI